MHIHIKWKTIILEKSRMDTVLNGWNPNTKSHGIDCCNVLEMAKKPSDWNSANWTWRKKSVSAKQSHYKSLSILIERTSFLFVAHFAPALDCLWMFTRAHAHTQAQLFFVLLRNRLLQICEREKKSEHTHTRTHTNTQIEKSPCMSIERRTRAFTSNYRIFLPLCSILMTGQTQNRVNVLRNVS